MCNYPVLCRMIALGGLVVLAPRGLSSGNVSPDGLLHASYQDATVDNLYDTNGCGIKSSHSMANK